MEKYILMLSLLATASQAREYFYQKPLAPFYSEDGKPQYVSTSKRMIIPGLNGRNYEVSMSPARNIFDMHLGSYQHYAQQNQANSVTGGNVADYGQYLGSPEALKNAAVYAQMLSQPLIHNANAQRYGEVTNQQYSFNAGQQNLGIQAHPQQLANTGAYAQQTAGAIGPYAQSLSGQISGNPGVYAQSQAHQGGQYLANQAAYNQPPQYPQHHPNAGPGTRYIRRCQPNGHCEYIADDRQQHQQVLQQARANIVPVANKCSSRPPPSPQGVHSQGQGTAPVNAGKNGLRDRRLFPYSEVTIAQYPNKK